MISGKWKLLMSCNPPPLLPFRLELSFCFWFVWSLTICFFHLNISNQRNMWGFDFSKLLPSRNSCSCHGQSSLHMVSVLLVRTLRPTAWLHKCFSSSFYCPASTPVLSSVAYHSHLFSTIIAVGGLQFPTAVAQLSQTESKKMSELGREACAGREKNAKYHLPVFFPGGFVFILRAWSSSKHMHTFNVSFWLKLGTVGLIKDVQTVSVHITFQGLCVCVCVCAHLIMNSRKTHCMHYSWNWANWFSEHKHKCFINARPSLNCKSTTNVFLIVAGFKLWCWSWG